MHIVQRKFCFSFPFQFSFLCYCSRFIFFNFLFLYFACCAAQSTASNTILPEQNQWNEKWTHGFYSSSQNYVCMTMARPQQETSVGLFRYIFIVCLLIVVKSSALTPISEQWPAVASSVYIKMMVALIGFCLSNVKKPHKKSMKKRQLICVLFFLLLRVSLHLGCTAVSFNLLVLLKIIYNCWIFFSDAHIEP